MNMRSDVGMTRWGWTVLVLLGLSGCGKTVLEDRGPGLTPDGEAGDELTWPRDGTELYFIHFPRDPLGANVGPPSLAAISMTGQMRVLDSTKANYWTVVLGADGSLYYTGTSDAPARRSLYAASTGEPLPILLGPKMDALAFSPDGRFLIYYGWDETLGTTVGPGRLKLRNLTDGSEITLSDGAPRARVTAGNHEVLTFSPSGSQVFYLAATGRDATAVGGGAVIDLATGAAEPRSATSGWYQPLVRWDDAGLRVADAWSGHYQIENLVSGEVTQLSQGPTPDLGLHDVWSPDGSRIAFWTNECLQGCGGGLSCCAVQTQLFVVELATSRATRVASGAASGGSIAFSPDSRRVAYVFGSRIHLRDVP